MGKLTSFDIIFANPTGVYYAGNTIQGHVDIQLSDTMTMRGIKLTFEGKARVKWQEGKTKHRASEEYFNKDTILHGVDSNSDWNTTTELASGRHTFPFEFQLPQGLPSSFEGGIGSVRYLVKCKIDKPWKFDHKVKKPFTVIGILDLNSEPDYSLPLKGQKEKNLCCLCCTSGNISADFHVERKGYVPGEAIKLFAEIHNASTQKMDKSYVTLKMKTTYIAGGFKNKTKVKLAKLKRPSIGERREDFWTGEQLTIPPVPPSFLTGCSIIDIRYILELTVVPSGMSLCLEVPLEIVIGSVPLAGVVQENPPMQPMLPIGFERSVIEPSLPGAADMYPPIPATGIRNLPPPSYAESVTGRVSIMDKDDDDDNEYTRGVLDYAPSYTYYNWGNTPQTLPVETERN